MKLNATGEFPFSEADELTVDIKIDEVDNLRIDFGKPIRWFSMPRQQAIEFALAVLNIAEVEKKNKWVL